jgi:hypothetical protein
MAAAANEKELLLEDKRKLNVLQREFARVKGSEAVTHYDKEWARSMEVPRNLAISNADRATFARYMTPYETDVMIRRSKNVRGLQREFLLTVDQPHLVRWIHAQEAFIQTLNPRDAFIVKSYTRHGDKLANGWARGGLPPRVTDLLEAAIAWGKIPFQYSMYDQYDALARMGVEMPPRELWTNKDGILRNDVVVDVVRDNMGFFERPEFLGNLLKQYIADIVSIMKRSPRLIGDIITYRGFKSEQHLKGLRYVAPDFGSTSVNPYTALDFTDIVSSGDHIVHCCIYELTVRAGVPCLYLGSITEFTDEYEILLPPSATYRLGREVIAKRIVPEDRSLSDLIDNPKKAFVKKEAMVVEGVVSWDEKRSSVPTRKRSKSAWTRENILAVEHTPRWKKPGKGRRFKTVRRNSSSERLDRISEALTVRSGRSGNFSE